MRRVLALIALAVLLGQSTGVMEFVNAEDCERRCAEDGAAEGRGAACELCACCAPPRHATLPIRSETLQASPGERIPGEQQRTPDGPDPGEILHVPKLAA